MFNRLMRLFFMVVLALIFTACNLPNRNQGLPVTPEAAYTAAAETIVAQLTELASPIAPVETPAASTPGATSQIATGTSAPSATPTTEVTPTTSPTPEATPTLTVQASATPASNDIRQGLGDPDWRDTFRNANNWSVYEDDHVRFRINNDRMLMVAFNADGRDSWVLTWPNPTNYYLEITATTDACSGLDRYGILFRSDAEVGYLLGLSCDGQYSLRSWDGERFKALVDWTSSSQIKSGAEQTNRLGVRVDGDDILIYINGIHQATVQDSTFSEDGFGVFVGSRNTANMRIELSEIAYWELD